MNGSNPDFVTRLALEPHPEGGWFRRIYTAEGSTATPRGERRCASSIHYLLTRDSPLGRLHRNESDILHLLQSGGPVEYLVYEEGQAPRYHRLGFDEGEALSLLVPGGCWKGSRLLPGAGLALVTELVVPGFDWSDHRYADPQWLQTQARPHQIPLGEFIAK